MAEVPSPVPLDAGRLNAELESLRAEVLRLQRKLGELHGGDLNALRRAYASLSQHVAALEEEARGMVAELAAFETQFIPPELVAQELGVAAAVAFGVALLRQTVKVLPLKAHTGAIIGQGLMLLGGAFVLARLTGGTLAHLASMFGRNVGRKRRLQKQLEAVEERIQIMAALQQWAETQEAAGPEPAPAGAASTVEQAAEAALEVPPPRRVSPATSSGSSAELVEMPQAEELEAAEAGLAAGGGVDTSAAPAGSGAAAAAGAVQQEEGRRAGAANSSSGGGGGGGGLQSLRAYVELGKKK